MKAPQIEQKRYVLIQRINANTSINIIAGNYALCKWKHKQVKPLGGKYFIIPDKK